MNVYVRDDNMRWLEPMEKVDLMSLPEGQFVLCGGLLPITSPAIPGAELVLKVGWGRSPVTKEMAMFVNIHDVEDPGRSLTLSAAVYCDGPTGVAGRPTWKVSFDVGAMHSGALGDDPWLVGHAIELATGNLVRVAGVAHARDVTVCVNHGLFKVNRCWGRVRDSLVQEHGYQREQYMGMHPGLYFMPPKTIAKVMP